MLDETVVGALDGAFAGALIAPGDPEYESARRVWNGMVDRRPAIILGRGYASFRFSHGYAADVAISIVLAATDDRAAGRVYNVAEPHATTPTERQRLERWARVAGWRGRIVEAPDESIPGGDGLPWPGQDWVLDTNRIRTQLGYAEHANEADAIRTAGGERFHFSGRGAAQLRLSAAV